MAMATALLISSPAAQAQSGAAQPSDSLAATRQLRLQRLEELIACNRRATTREQLNACLPGYSGQLAGSFQTEQQTRIRLLQTFESCLRRATDLQQLQGCTKENQRQASAAPVAPAGNTTSQAREAAIRAICRLSYSRNDPATAVSWFIVHSARSPLSDKASRNTWELNWLAANGGSIQRGESNYKALRQWLQSVPAGMNAFQAASKRSDELLTQLNGCRGR